MTNPSNLDRELELARELLEQAKGNPSLERQILETVGRLSALRDKHEVLEHNYLHRSAVMRLGELVVQAVVEELQGIDGWEDIVDRIGQRLIPAIQGVTNTPTELRRIERRES
jgi:hypothetical protein